MALVYAVKNGVWSDTTVWNTGVLPAAVDIVRPNNFTVTIDVNVTVTEIRNDAAAPAVAGGSFTLNSGLTVNSNIIAGQAGGASGHIIKYSSVGASTINGIITNVSANSNFVAILNSGSGTLNINGDVIFTQNNSTFPTQGLIENTSNGIINITGTVNGNIIGANRVQCVVNVSTGTINIVGNVNSPTVAGALFFTVVNSSTGTITINGNINSTASTTIDNRSSGTVTISGGTYSSNGGAILSNTSGTVTITGNCTSTVAAGNTITNATGTVTLNGNFTHTHTNTQIIATKILNSGAGIFNINGDISADFIGLAANGNSSGALISNDGSGSINIVGNISQISINSGINSNNTRTIRNSSVGVINITGNILGSSHLATGLASAVDNQSTGIINITGTLIPGSTRILTGRSYCVTNTGGGVVNFIGTANGDAFNISLASISNESSGAINITGNVIGGSTGLAVVNNSTGTITVNGNAIGGTGWFAIEGVNAAGNTIIERAVYTAQGQSPITGYIKFKTTNPEIDVLREDAVIVTLRDPLNVSGLLPNTSDVRSGTAYNSGSSTGTLAIPAPNLVQLGVPVDNTVGTGNLTPQDFWDYLISNGFVGGSIGERLKNASTVDTTGAQIAGFIV